MRYRTSVAVLASIALLGGCTADPPAAPAPGVSTSAGPSRPSGPYAQWAAGRSTPVVDPLYPERGTDAAGHDFTSLIDTWLDSPTTPPEAGPLPQ